MREARSLWRHVAIMVEISYYWFEQHYVDLCPVFINIYSHDKPVGIVCLVFDGVMKKVMTYERSTFFQVL